MAEEFRFVYTTGRYEDTVAFYDRLGFERAGGWDRGHGDRGTLFAVGPALVEVTFREAAPPFSEEVWIALEVDDADTAHAEARGRGVEPESDPGEMAWGHRSFAVRDPNGLRLVLYEKLPGAAT